MEKINLPMPHICGFPVPEYEGEKQRVQSVYPC
jgi:hypothetical protein